MWERVSVRLRRGEARSDKQDVLEKRGQINLRQIPQLCFLRSTFEHRTANDRRRLPKPSQSAIRRPHPNRRFAPLPRCKVSDTVSALRLTVFVRVGREGAEEGGRVPVWVEGREDVCSWILEDEDDDVACCGRDDIADHHQVESSQPTCL